MSSLTPFLHQWVVKVDIENFFDTVDHEMLIDLVAEEVADGRVLRLIRSFLKAGVMEEMKVEYQTTGTPQGGVTSPLLANIYLHPYDCAMTQLGYKVIRYADDIVIMCRSRKEAERALEKTREVLEGRLNLNQLKLGHAQPLSRFGMKIRFKDLSWLVNPPEADKLG